MCDRGSDDGDEQGWAAYREGEDAASEINVEGAGPGRRAG